MPHGARTRSGFAFFSLVAGFSSRRCWTSIRFRRWGGRGPADHRLRGVGV